MSERLNFNPSDTLMIAPISKEAPMTDAPTIRASLTLVSQLARGRNTGDLQYRPHIVIGPMDQREVDINGTVGEMYWGVLFMDKNLQMNPGQTIEVTMALMYYRQSEFSYEEVVPGAEFTLREGGSIIGYGSVLSRSS